MPWKPEQDNTDLQKGAQEYELLEKTKKLRSEPSQIYVQKADKFKDLQSTAYTFLIFGSLGLLFVLLNVFEVITFLNGLLSYITLGIIFIGFIMVGINSFSRAQIIKPEIEEEEAVTTQINAWLKEHITEASLKEIEDTTRSNEMNVLYKMEHIKEQIINEFGEMNESYLEQLVEEFYNKNFDIV